MTQRVFEAVDKQGNTVYTDEYGRLFEKQYIGGVACLQETLLFVSDIYDRGELDYVDYFTLPSKGGKTVLDNVLRYLGNQ
ncbi:MAG: hypothetical protein NC350_05075 [Corallococcus sp.]|nr:hypothetical protein [Corallococcus sp.]